MIREVTLSEMLTARETRAWKQECMLTEYKVPLISFTMNIAGPIKDTPLIRRSFFYGQTALKSALQASGFPILHEETVLAHTGCEAMYAVQTDAVALKQLCTSIEESCALGRLFDMDVLDLDGKKLERGVERCCIVCGMQGRGCASRRTHSLEELQTATRRIMETFFAEQDGEQIGWMVTHSLVEEVLTTPKPGLVDMNNTGSHRDMRVSTFLASAEALAPYWRKCFHLGIETAEDTPDETFHHIQAAGMNAEKTMLAATGGVNTHKGAIYILGVVCGAIGRKWHAESPCRDADAILCECATIVQHNAQKHFTQLSENPQSTCTAGDKLYLQYGLRGARGEVADGLPGVALHALPVFCRMLGQGYSRNDAGVTALLSLIARGTDTNMVSRGGPRAAQEAAEMAGKLLSGGGVPSLENVRRMDEQFIQWNLSPGGCADLLAVTYFLFDWSKPAGV